MTMYAIYQILIFHLMNDIRIRCLLIRQCQVVHHVWYLASHRTRQEHFCVMFKCITRGVAFPVILVFKNAEDCQLCCIDVKPCVLNTATPIYCCGNVCLSERAIEKEQGWQISGLQFSAPSGAYCTNFLGAHDSAGQGRPAVSRQSSMP